MTRAAISRLVVRPVPAIVLSAWLAAVSAHAQTAQAPFPAAPDAVRVMWLLARQDDGSWKIAASMWNAVPVPAVK
jgi:hypothetical protein